ncbi:N-acetylneuraminate synthase [Candidatus Gottesmanbacteria bacterium RIFCSPLOWO2_01_FULL_48_11]|uniref:PseI/NeuA/B-like domain-containing protein n=2 Tax=Candidatus Gottesmaniibacteriota TaxID=1752720 RepID=A0A0G1U202_9BACT|nr:MAG: hypothetical protein UY16_C0013G0004 [Candidatus Gottesmanbacteria bacterium GW2011_GWA2_47_9]OGG28479.1 MAG: N-acetylneuraminate synthase [Candidatus Gottesmanbacteria bacterium RIFCSPLOWO2_01_FULL_48_11]
MLHNRKKTVQLGDQAVGAGLPVYIVAEIGINHNGNLKLAKRLIDAAKSAGCNSVKFQKRKPELCVPKGEKTKKLETPWGYISYLEYRKKIEFGHKEYQEIDRYCRKRGIAWFVSVWDTPSVDFMEQFRPMCYKVPSAMLSDADLLMRVRKTGRPVILSTGMSTMRQIQSSVKVLGIRDLIINHCTSAYPCPVEELNLRMITRLGQMFDCPIGYSGHEVGLATTVAAVALGACYIERHITLDRAMWGTDQAASVEPGGFSRLVKYIRVVEAALGDGIKKIYDSERPAMRKLRRI